MFHPVPFPKAKPRGIGVVIIPKNIQQWTSGIEALRSLGETRGDATRCIQAMAKSYNIVGLLS